jgi:hypothetical protein
MGESLNQPSRVQDEGALPCKLLLSGEKIRSAELMVPEE